MPVPCSVSTSRGGESDVHRLGPEERHLAPPGHWSRQPDTPEAPQPFPNRDLVSNANQPRTRAGSSANAERELSGGPPGPVDPVGIGKLLRITICRRDHQRYPVALGDLEIAQVDIRTRPAEKPRDDAGVAKHLLHGQ